jgi:hypothetical protein
MEPSGGQVERFWGVGVESGSEWFEGKVPFNCIAFPSLVLVLSFNVAAAI